MKTNMLRLFVWGISLMFLILLIPILAWPETKITFQWDRNSENDLAGYRLYQSDTSGSYTYGPGKEVAEIKVISEDHPDTVTIINVPDGTWYWVLTAFDAHGNESGPSNEVTQTFDTTPPERPFFLRCLGF